MDNELVKRIERLEEKVERLDNESAVNRPLGPSPKQQLEKTKRSFEGINVKEISDEEFDKHLNPTFEQDDEEFFLGLANEKEKAKEQLVEAMKLLKRCRDVVSLPQTKEYISLVIDIDEWREKNGEYDGIWVRREIMDKPKPPQGHFITEGKNPRKGKEERKK